MINTSFNLASIAGIIIAVAGAALYAIRSVRPELSRDHDIFFSAVGLLCGLILVFYGWRFDPIMQFGQILLTGATIFFAVENLRLRSVTAEQAKRNTPIVDEDRPVSRVYETVHAELDELEPLEDEQPPVRRQIRGSRDARSTRNAEYDDEAPRRRRTTDEYEDESRSRSSNRSKSNQRLEQGDKPRRRSSRPASRPVERINEDEWGSSKRSDDDWNSSDSSVSGQSNDWSGVSKSSRSSSNSSSSTDRSSDTSVRPKKRRPPQDTAYRRETDGSVTPTDYVDYKPVENPGDEPDNSSNFDER